MKVIEHIKKTKSLRFSYEILPPQRGQHIKVILDVVSKLKQLDPAWINVTSHASSLIENKDPLGVIQKKIYKKRPGTISVCGLIQNKFEIDAVAHMLCNGFDRDETENALIELSYLGIENVLALRGDKLNYDKSLAKGKLINHHANELVEQIQGIKAGKFLDDTEYFPYDFCIGVAGYPEKHGSAVDLDTDINYLKQKVSAGAEYIITQMFFDNNKYYSFVEKCREAEITVPIIPGLKLLRSVKQLQSLPKIFNIEFPDDLISNVVKNPNAALTIGQEWLKYQIKDLVANKINNIHLFLINDVDNIVDVIRQI